jgi:glycosyl transferase family 25
MEHCVALSWSILSLICVATISLNVIRMRYVKRCNLQYIPRFDVYFINMKEAPGRLSRFMRRYKACDLYETHSPIRFEAVNGKELKLSTHVTSKALRQILQAERRQYRTLHYELTRGAIGCLLSHRGVWESLIRSDSPAALVFEDDSIMDPDLGSVIDNLAIPAGADIVLLGYFCNKCQRTACGVARVWKFFGLHGYLITRSGAEKILRQPEMYTVGKQVDALLGDFARRGELNIYATMKQYVVQDPTIKTSIQMVLKERKGVDPWDDNL